MEGRPLDERELIAGAKRGDLHAFEELVRAHQTLALRIAYLVVRDHAEAEDVTQEAFIKAFRHLHRFRDGAPFRPWLLRIVRNEALNRARAVGRAQRLALRLAGDPVSGDAAPSPDAEVVSRDEQRRLIELLDMLPDRQRAVVWHLHVIGLSHVEVASLLGIPVGTVKSRASRALRRLSDWIDGEER